MPSDADAPDATWAALFERARAADREVSVAAVRATLQRRRDDR